MRVDSAVHRDRRGSDSLDIFVDSLKTRIAISDSTGAFAIRALEPGAYMFDIRRIGYEPLHGALSVDSTTLSANIYLNVVSRVLAKVVVTESSVDRVKQKLDRDGFVERSHLGIAAQFVERKDILKQRPQTLEDILRWYAVEDPTIRIDRVPISYDAVRDYPADLVIGVEIYRHSRPTEFNATRSRGLVLSDQKPEGPLVLVWTFIP